MYLENINGPEDVKKLSLEEMETLAEEMRGALLKRASIHGGHFGPNFGMVEATIALHYVFESPKDKIVFDVSHQTYPHKMLTGRLQTQVIPKTTLEKTGTQSPQTIQQATAIRRRVIMTTLSLAIHLLLSASPAVLQKEETFRDSQAM